MSSKARSYQLTLQALNLILCVSVIWGGVGMVGCTVDNPDYSEVAVSAERVSEGGTSGGGTSGGGTSGGGTSGGGTSGGGASGGETSGGETSGGETSGGETSGGETSGGETSGGETSGGETSGEDLPPTDADEDGYFTPDDCDDQNAQIYPGRAEVCDARDQDCDGQVDEELDETCIAISHTVNAPETVILWGDQLTLVGDLDGDGVSDALVRGRRNDRIRLIAVSAKGEQLWAVNGDGDFARAITYGDYLGDGSTQIITADPENDRAVAYNELGQTIGTFPINDGLVSSLVTLRAGMRDLLVIGMPERYTSRGSTRTQGRLVVLRFDASLGLGSPEAVYVRNGESLQEWGERMFNIGDLDGDGVDDLVFTRVIVFEDRSDIGTQVMSGAQGETSVDSLFFTFDETYSSFATSIAIGRFNPDGGLSYVFGAPLVSEGALEGGGLYTLTLRPEGVFEEDPLYGGREFDGLGSRLTTLPRPSEPTDLLLIGSRESIIYRDPQAGEIDELIMAEPGLSLGKGLVTSREPGPDGAYRIWVSGISERGGESVVWIYSAR